MRKNAIKRILFTMTGLFSFSAAASAQQPTDLRLLEELPTEQRVQVYQQVIGFLNRHPEIAVDAKIIAVDRKGTIYVLDENTVVLAGIGSPSVI